MASEFRPAANGNGNGRRRLPQLPQIPTSPGELAKRMFDLVETATWRAANFQVPSREQMNQMVQSRLGDLTGAVMERGYKLMEMANRARGVKPMSYDDERE